MSRAYTKDICVLAIDPSTRGFGFAVLEGPNRLIDWGVKETKKNKNARTLKLIEELIDRYLPNVIVVEDYAGKGSRRCDRISELINDISKLASKRNIKVRSFSRTKVKQAFSESGASNKYEIAIAIAKRFPELAPRLPRFRKPWMSEDYRMSIFDAVAFGLVFVFSEDKRTPYNISSGTAQAYRLAPKLKATRNRLLQESKLLLRHRIKQCPVDNLLFTNNASL